MLHGVRRVSRHPSAVPLLPSGRAARATLAPLAALAAGLLGVGVSVPRADAQPPASAAPATRAGRVVVDTLRSAALGTRKPFLVYLPPSYDREPARRFPVAVYLHGLWGNETNWTRLGQLHLVADSLAAAGAPELIVVMPDGDDSWYTTWNQLVTQAECERPNAWRRGAAEGYCVPWPRYDEYVARDLVARVDSSYRTIPDRAHRGIAGLSMGGYGAFALALRYPEVFSAAHSHSGVVAPLFAGPSPFAPPARWATSIDGRRWGVYWTTLPLAFGRDTAGWWARDPSRLAARLQRERPALMPALRFDVGTEDGLVTQNRALHWLFGEMGVAHEYAEAPGAHDFRYWRAHVGESLAWLGARLAPDGAARAGAGRAGR